jgi:trehalose-phosphatase
MSDPLSEARQRILAARQSGHRLLLLFDYDGTLAPFAERPSEAILPARTRELLARLNALPGVRVGILSGRALADVETMVHLPGLIYGGTAGLELQVDGEEVHHILTDEERQALMQATRQLQHLAARYPGAWVETKPAGMTLHYREVPDALAGTVRAEGRAVLHGWPGRFRVMDGPRAVEAILAVGRDKGESVRWLLAHVGNPVFPVCFGDSENDQPALALANQMGGISVGIGEYAPREAHCHLPDPASLAAWLEELLSGLA